MKRQSLSVDLSLLLIFVVTLFIASCATTPESVSQRVPLPNDTKIIPPDQSIPRELAAFSGKWIGAWDGNIDHILVVEKIESPTKVTVIYGVGASPSWGSYQPTVYRIVGQFSGKELVLKSSTGNTVTYEMWKGKLLGAYKYDWKTFQSELKKVE